MNFLQKYSRLCSWFNACRAGKAIYSIQQARKSQPDQRLQRSAIACAAGCCRRYTRVDQRLPDNPLVLTPIDGVKNYGGYIRTVTSEWAGGYMEETQYGHSPLRWINDGQGIGLGMCDTWSTNANNTQSTCIFAKA